MGSASRFFEEEDDTTEIPPRRQRRKTDPAGAINWSVVFQVVGWIIGAVLTYNAITQRVAIVETQQRLMADDVREMRNDIKTLLQRR